MTRHLVGRDATLSVQVDGEWVNVGTVGHLDYPKVEPAAGAVVLFEEYAEISDRVFEAVKPGSLTKRIGGQKKPPPERQPTRNHKIFDPWGRLK